MMKPSDDDTWVATLAGRALPHDLETRQAARARAVIEAQLRVDLDAAPDPVGEARWLAALAGAGVGTAASAPSPEPGLIVRFVRWVFGSEPAAGGFTGGRLAFTMLMVIGVGVLIVQVQPFSDGDVVPKVAPAAPTLTQPALGVVDSARPLEDAIQLRDALRGLGLRPTVMELGDATRLEAEVSAEQAGEVQRLLRGVGIEWAFSQRLSVEFRRRP